MSSGAWIRTSIHQPLHRAVPERQRPLDLAEVPARGELRHHARRGHRQLPARAPALAFNGLILVSVATDIEAIFAELPGNDRPYAVYLPAYAAVAWYHHMLPDAAGGARAVPRRGARLRRRPVHRGAAQGRRAERRGARRGGREDARVHRAARSSTSRRRTCASRRIAFCHELLKAQRKTVGRLDGRFVGPTWDPLDKEADYDPQSAAISAAYAATFLDYYHGELKFGQGATYRTTNFSIGDKWKWTHQTAHGEQPLVNSGVDLAEALMKDASLRVLVLNGYYDLATPFSATEYVMTHLGVPPAVSARIQMKYYEAGHMMYVNPPRSPR